MVLILVLFLQSMLLLLCFLLLGALYGNVALMQRSQKEMEIILATLVQENQKVIVALGETIEAVRHKFLKTSTGED